MLETKNKKTNDSYTRKQFFGLSSRTLIKHRCVTHLYSITLIGNMKHAAFFNGMGGFQLAAEWIGWENYMSCEIDDFCNKITKYHYPNCIQHGDIKTTDFTVYRGLIDIITGGFPCQPYSTAGLRKGKEDDRHLWPENLRGIREIQPPWVVGENVRGLTNWNGGLVFDEVQADLETEGYKVLPFLLPACAVNAPHRRDRIWFVAYSESNDDRRTKRKLHSEDGGQIGELLSTLSSTGEGFSGEGLASNGLNEEQREQAIGGLRSESGRIYQGAATNSDSNVHKGGLDDGRHRAPQGGSESKDEQQGGWNENGERLRVESGASGKGTPKGNWENFPAVSPLCNGDDGFPAFMDSDAFFKEIGIQHPRQPAIGFAKWRNESIKAGGNAIVPQVAYEIFKVIEKMNIDRQLNP
jgi:DNA (cytosine-5)-methyltransferase 1